MERKVNLFLIGAMRAGTTSLVELLSRHPDIYVPPIKEPNYFTEDLPKELYSPPKNFSIDHYFEKDFPKKRLHIAHIQRKEHYEKLYSGARNEKYLLDASTAYLYAPGVAKRIYEYNPEAKIIVLLRDPWERMLSHIYMDYGLGRTKEPLDEILNRQLDSHNANNASWFDYVSMSLYHSKIEEFQYLFSNVKVLSLKELTTNPENVLNKLAIDFALDSFKDRGLMKLNMSQAKSPLNGIHQKYQKHFKSYLRKIFGSKLRQLVFNKMIEFQRQENDISDKFKKEFEIIFSKDELICESRTI